MNAFTKFLTKVFGLQGKQTLGPFHYPSYYPQIFRIKRLHPDAKIPTRAKPGDAGLDLYALEDGVVPASFQSAAYDAFSEEGDVEIGHAIIPTGIAVQIPFGLWGEIKSRSGLGFNHGIEVGAGTIDAGYRDGIKVKLYNFTDKPYQVKKGDRIAQLVIQKCELLQPIEVAELSPAERGENGFGSSGR